MSICRICGEEVHQGVGSYFNEDGTYICYKCNNTTTEKIQKKINTEFGLIENHLKPIHILNRKLEGFNLIDGSRFDTDEGYLYGDVIILKSPIIHHSKKEFISDNDGNTLVSLDNIIEIMKPYHTCKRSINVYLADDTIHYEDRPEGFIKVIELPNPITHHFKYPRYKILETCSE